MRGPKPTPTAVLNLRGSWRGKSRKGEPQPEVTIPDPPAVVTGRALEEWNRMAPILQATGCLTLADVAIFTIYCQAYADWQDALEQIIATGGPIVRAPTGFAMPNPYLTIRNQAAKHLLSSAAELGLSPSARTRIKAEPAATKDSSKIMARKRQA